MRAVINNTTYFFRKQQRIEFRDAKDLNTVVLDHSVGIDDPGIMCASSNGSLWYQIYIPNDPFEFDEFDLMFNLYGKTYSSPPYELHQLDCSSSPSSPVKVFSRRKIVYDMCCAELEGNPLLVTVGGYIGVTAHNTSTGEFLWSTRGSIPYSQKDMFARGITADEHGRLFVLDARNKCIHVFSVYGKYVTTVLRKGGTRYCRTA